MWADVKERSGSGTEIGIANGDQARMTVIGSVFLLLTLCSLLIKPSYFPILIAASIPFPHTAAFIFQDNGLNVFFMLAMIAAVRYAYLVVRSRQANEPLFGRPMSLVVAVSAAVFAGYSVLISFVGPALFRGVDVFAPRGGIDEQVGQMSSLEFSVSNLAQPLYVLLGFAVVLYLGKEHSVSPRIFDVAMWLGVGLALVRAIAPTIWPVTLVENMPNVSYATTQSGLRGTFSEPSLFGLFLITCLAYSVASAVTSLGRRRIAMSIASAVIIGEMALNLSWTMIATLCILIGFVAVIALAKLAGRLSTRGRVYFGAVSLALVGIFLSLLPWATGIVTTLLDEKLSSDSVHNRSASNSAAIDLFWNTWGLGAGLGSNRPSSLLALLLSCVGVIGTAAFLTMVCSAVIGVGRWPHLLSVACALVACVVSQAVSAPELSMPVFWLLLGLLFWKRFQRRPEAYQPVGIPQTTNRAPID